MRQFMKGTPDQLSDAAKIDGAGKFRIYWQIIIPLCLPIIAFTMVNTLLGIWNDFMNPLLYLGSNERLYTISFGLYMDFMMSGANNPLANVQMAGGVLMLLPCIVLFFCLLYPLQAECGEYSVGVTQFVRESAGNAPQKT